MISEIRKQKVWQKKKTCLKNWRLTEAIEAIHQTKQLKKATGMPFEF